MDILFMIFYIVTFSLIGRNFEKLNIINEPAYYAMYGWFGGALFVEIFFK